MMMHRYICEVLFGICAMAFLVPGVPGLQPERVRLPPVDQAAQDPSFAEFRKAFRAALDRRDVRSVIDAVSPLARIDSERRGQKFFERELSIPRSAMGGQEHEYWSALSRTLSRGGAFTTTRGAEPGRREFCAPYIYTLFPKVLPDNLAGEADPWVILGSNVAARREADYKSPVVTRLSFDLVKSSGLKIGGWQEIELPDGPTAYVWGDLIADPGDYHACFAKFGTKWLMTEFSHGEAIPWAPVPEPR
jgi:hypothetical protein